MPIGLALKLYGVNATIIIFVFVLYCTGSVLIDICPSRV